MAPRSLSQMLLVSSIFMAQAILVILTGHPPLLETVWNKLHEGAPWFLMPRQKILYISALLPSGSQIQLLN